MINATELVRWILRSGRRCLSWKVWHMSKEEWADTLGVFGDSALRVLEFLTVLVLTASVILVIVYEMLWIFWHPSLRQARFVTAVKTLNDNWKVGLIAAVPLFYRTIRGFMERVEEFGGAKAPRLPKVTTPEKPNPEPNADAAGE